jgi:hypothetical protein
MNWRVFLRYICVEGVVCRSMYVCISIICLVICLAWRCLLANASEKYYIYQLQLVIVVHHWSNPNIYRRLLFCCWKLYIQMWFLYSFVRFFNRSNDSSFALPNPDQRCHLYNTRDWSRCCRSPSSPPSPPLDLFRINSCYASGSGHVRHVNF